MINCLFCGNQGVFDGVLTCILSILKRTSSKEPFCFYLFTMDASDLDPSYVPITDGQTEFLDEVIKKYDPNNVMVKVDVTGLYREEFGGCPNESAYCSPYTLLRLLVDRVDGMPDKLLYLDADILFNRDVRLLYDHDVSNVEYAAAPDHYGKYLVNPHYINAGVLLMNLEKIRETDIMKNARNILRRRKLLFADQSAIRRSTTKKMMLPQKYNDQKFLHDHTVVRHFSRRMFWFPYPHVANIKQWQVDDVRRIFGYECFDDVLNEYIELKTRFEKNEAARLAQ